MVAVVPSKSNWPYHPTPQDYDHWALVAFGVPVLAASFGFGLRWAANGFYRVQHATSTNRGGWFVEIPNRIALAVFLALAGFVALANALMRM